MRPVLAEIRKHYPQPVRIIMGYATVHDGSETVARILETARIQDIFEPVPDGLLATQPQWADHSGPQLDIAWAAAVKAGFDIKKARAIFHCD